MRFLFKFLTLALVILAGCDEADLSDTTPSQNSEIADAFAAFEQACLQPDSTFPGWREIMTRNGVSEAGRLKFKLPESYPSGDVIVYEGKYKDQSKNNAIRDCNVLIKGNHLSEVNTLLRGVLEATPWKNTRTASLYYIPSSRETSNLSKSYFLPNNEIALIYSRTTTVGNAGVLTALNVTIYSASDF